MVSAFDTPLCSDRRLHIALTLVMGLGMVSHLALLLKDVKPGGLTVMALIFPAWVALPWALIWGCARLARGRRVASWGVAGLALLYLVLGTWAYADALYIHPDPQGALIFLFVPLLEVLPALLLMAGLWLSRPRLPAPR